MKLNKKHIKSTLNKVDKRKIKTLSVKHNLNNEQLIFALELIKTGNATQSYVVAYNKESGSASVRNMARSLRDNPKIINFNADLMEILMADADDEIATPFDIMFSLSSVINGELLTTDRMGAIKNKLSELLEYLETNEDNSGINMLNEVLDMLDNVGYAVVKDSDRIAASKLLSELHGTLNLDKAQMKNNQPSNRQLSDEDIKAIQAEVYDIE